MTCAFSREGPKQVNNTFNEVACCTMKCPIASFPRFAAQRGQTWNRRSHRIQNFNWIIINITCSTSRCPIIMMVLIYKMNHTREVDGCRSNIHIIYISINQRQSHTAFFKSKQCSSSRWLQNRWTSIST